MTIDPDPAEGETPADLITPHKDAESNPSEAPEPEVNPGIEDPRRSRTGPEILDPPAHGLTPRDSE